MPVRSFRPDLKTIGTETTEMFDRVFASNTKGLFIWSRSSYLHDGKEFGHILNGH